MAIAPAAPGPQSKQINRAEIVDGNFVDFARQLGSADRADPALRAELNQSGLDLATLEQLVESQMMTRHLDLMARVLRLQNRVFYTIGSSGHEANALVGHLTRHTDPAFLHYRSGGFMVERLRKVGVDPIMDSALSFAAAASDPASGGRHKVWGSRPAWVLPQTSTIASQLPKAVGTALAIEHARRVGHDLPIADDSIAVVSLGDASCNHSTAQGAFNAVQWTRHQGLPVPLLIVCEDNNWGISVRTPSGWIESSFSSRPGMRYMAADGLHSERAWPVIAAAVEHCRRRREPVFLHLKTVRLLGHAGTDFEVDYRKLSELEAAEARDPLLHSARLLHAAGWSGERIVSAYESIRSRCFEAADRASLEPKLVSLAEVSEPLAPYSPFKVRIEAERDDFAAERVKYFGSLRALPENQPPKHLAIQINRVLTEMMVKYPQALIFGEDVAQKGGVYTVTRGLAQKFGGKRVFNTLLDEQTILGLAQGYANMGMLPIPEIQYLAYYHNACDQIRGEACSLQFFSNNQFRNPMVMRVAGLGYQKGFGGHFHNDNSIAALRDIPGLTVACPSRGDDAVMMMRTLMALAMVDGRVSAFLEPIALYMTKDLHQPGDNQWCFDYPEPGKAIEIGEGRVYEPEATDAVIVTYGNGVPMALQAARRWAENTGLRARVLDLRWLVPLNGEWIVNNVEGVSRVVILDEGRRSAGVGEGVYTALVEGLRQLPAIERVVGADCYTPLADAATTVLPCTEDVYKALNSLAEQRSDT